MKTYSLLCLPLLFFTSCATITRGVHEKLKVVSDPSGANVVLSTGEKGITPATFVEKRRRDALTVTISKPGFATQTVTVVSKAGGTGVSAMAGNVLIGGAIGMGVDAGTGAYNSLYPNPVSVHLVPTSKTKMSKRSTTSSSAEKPRPKSKTTKTAAKVETAPKMDTTTRSESAPTPAPISTPYVPPTLETSPSP
ncbi:MAG TPA: PEGA domain-containing protein [Chthoniobacterales bacterium]|jgi:hypothetical protein|nr:PEGA domain-containing protein [Chthoniobacterales bacterium]